MPSIAVKPCFWDQFDIVYYYSITSISGGHFQEISRIELRLGFISKIVDV